MQIALLALAGCAIILIPTLLFLLVVHPIWAFVELCSAALVGRATKIIWLLFLLIFAIIASVPYALFVSASGALRRVTVISLLLVGVVCGIGYGVLHLNPHLKSSVSKQIEEATRAYDKFQELSKLTKQIPW